MDSALFTSLGMFIIDDNEYPESWNRPAERDIIGGGGTYSIVGARIISGSKYGHQITGIIDRGRDFPVDVQKELDSWGTGIVYRTDESRLTTRGRNTYDVNDVRHFDYLTDKKRLDIDDLLEDQWLIQSKCFHLICSVDRCYQLVEGIKKYNKDAIFIYEPLPSDCLNENLDSLNRLLPLIQIFTPNSNEGAQFLGIQEPKDLETIETVTRTFVDMGVANCVLRCGPMGCYVASKDVGKHLPAYHQDQANVVDVTGGGNSFCGGFMVGFYLSNNLVIGGICGNVTSGCIIEKLGMPTRDGEHWNGMSTKDRLAHYIEKNPNIGVSIEMFDWF